MKQIIVMISMIALGITLAGFVMGFGTSAEAIADAAKTEINYSSITDATTTD